MPRTKQPSLVDVLGSMPSGPITYRENAYHLSERNRFMAQIPVTYPSTTMSEHSPETVKAVVLTPDQAKFKKLSVWVATVRTVPVIGEVLILNEMILTDLYVKWWDYMAVKTRDLKAGSLVIINQTGEDLGLLKPMVVAAIEKNALMTAGRTMTLANAFVDGHLMALRNDATYYVMDEGMKNLFNAEQRLLTNYSKYSSLNQRSY